jgi:hypothetical protein
MSGVVIAMAKKERLREADAKPGKSKPRIKAVCSPIELEDSSFNYA